MSSAVAAFAVPASAATITHAPPPVESGQTFTVCGWGYATLTSAGTWARGETIKTPNTTDTVLDQFSFWVGHDDLSSTSTGPWDQPQTIAYKAYVTEWDGSAPGATLWSSPERQVTTTQVQQEVVTETGGVTLVPGQQYAIFLSTHETTASMTPTDLGCFWLNDATLYADGFGVTWGSNGSGTLQNWQFGEAIETAFSATFSAPPPPDPEPIYTFDGFYQPVENRDAAGTLILNRVQAGSAVPLKFRLGGDFGLDVFAEGYPKSMAIACDSDAVVDDVDETVNAGASSLQYDATTGIYTYVWKTDKAWEDTCRQLVIQFDDGTTARANFTLK